MMKKENAILSFPDTWAAAPCSPTPAPPGFPPQPPETCTSGFSRNQNQTPDDFCEDQPPRRTSRKRSRPQFYAPTTAQPPAPGERRRGRPPKAEYQSPLVHLETETRSRPQFYAPITARPLEPGQRRRGRRPKAGCQSPLVHLETETRSRPQFYVPKPARLPAQVQRRRGRPPKAGYQSPLVHLETETRNNNQDSSIPSRMPEEKISSFISSLEITMDQSSLRVNDEVAEHGSQINTSPSPHHLVAPIKTGDISVDKIRPRVVQSSSFHAEDIEKTLIDVSFTEVPGPVSCYEKARNLSCNYQISEGIDPKILQHVANALQYMAGTQTALDDAKVISRSSDINKNLVYTLKAINKKHGDITQDCSLESDCMKTLVLLGICKVVQDLQKKQLKDLDINSLGSYYTAVSDAENMKVNVQWLHIRLDEIKDALNLSDEAKGFINEREVRVGNISRKKIELERLKSEVQGIEEQLAREVVMVEELNQKFGDQMSKISRFQHANLMDGLI